MGHYICLMFRSLTTFIIAVLLGLPLFSVAQADTVTVQTFTFADITKRRGTYAFPPAGERYRKILMYHTLKCDAATTQDQYPCGEWDYLTYHYVFQHTGVMDSVRYAHPKYQTPSGAPTQFSGTITPAHNIFQSLQSLLIVDSIESESVIYTGNTQINSPTIFQNGKNRAIFAYPATELISNGFSAGTFQRISLNFLTPGLDLGTFSVRIGTGSLASNALQSASPAFQHQTQVQQAGENIYYLLNPFTWDGVSDLLVEFSYDATYTSAQNEVAADTTAYTSGLLIPSDAYFRFTGSQFLEIPADGYDFGNEVSIAFRCWGDPAVMPSNTVILSAIDSLGDRSLNIHLPWSDGNVYWDAGQGSGYDRISKAVPVNIYEGSWNYWVFTKNSATGTMKIYLNGQLWHTGTGLSRPVGKIRRFKIGNTVENWNAPFPGAMDQIAVWNTELDSATIASWMNKDITSQHPNYNQLMFAYNVKPGAPWQDASSNGRNAMPENPPAVQMYTSADQPAIVLPMSQRPVIGMYNGIYQTQSVQTIVSDTVVATPLYYTEYAVQNDAFIPVANGTLWTQNYDYIYGPTGTLIDSIQLTGFPITIVNSELEYYGVPYEVLRRFEIGRFITPYGIGLDLGVNGFRWVYDVTDYAWLLHDSVDIAAGNQQELIDLKFVMIKGEPPADVVSHDFIWGEDASYSYAGLSNNTALPEKSVALQPGAQHHRIKTRITGHGHASNDGNYPHCCEWKDNTHYLYMNGQQVDNWKVFKYNQCALNPVYPQGGTWPGAREGWCPGDIVDVRETPIVPPAGDSVKIDYGITAVPTNNLGMGNGNYVIAAELFQYNAPNNTTDAELYEVLAPSSDGYYSRFNPVCYDPMIVLRNSGKNPLTSATITYRVSGGPVQTYQWSGNLAFLEKTNVQLPVPDESFWVGDGSNRFIATVSNPNGLSDQYADNDTYVSAFRLPDMYQDNFVVQMSTNNRANENSWTIKDVNGNVVYSRSNLTNNLVYKDTLNLEPGCYTFELLDLGNDGLKYWADPAQGNGSIRFRKYNSQATVKAFQPEFGRSIKYSFVVGGYMNIQEPETAKIVEVYPNPSAGEFTLDLIGYNGKYELIVLNISGEQVFSRRIQAFGNNIEILPLNNLPSGIYFLKMFNAEEVIVKRLVISK